MPVFSEGDRTRLGPPKAGEPIFSYLDASARAEATQARATIEDWAKDYPHDQLGRWLGDFRSDDRGQHESAFFELFLFKFFAAAGWQVTVEPEVAGVDGRPDFLIEHESGLRMVIEAISPNAKSDRVRGKEKLIADIKDAVNSVEVADCYLIFEAIEGPSQSINKSKLIGALKNWLEQKPTKEDVFTYEDKGALVKIQVMPSSVRATDSPDYRAIGVEMGGVSVSTPGETVKRALLKKAAKYRVLDLPYVIALNARSMHDTEDDFLAATYGTLAVQYRIGPEGVVGEPQWVRNEDGLFNEGGRPRKLNVSAVLIFNGVAPWNWQDRVSCVIHNAYARHPLGELTFGGDAFIPKNDVLEKVEGSRVGELLK